MEKYINNFETFDKSIAYNFQLGWGGLADCIKFFMFILEQCIKDNKKLYYIKNNTLVEKYIKLKYDILHIDENKIKELDAEIITPQKCYKIFDINVIKIPIRDVFYFSDEVKINCINLFPSDIKNYISIHLRLGDKHLETNPDYIFCKNDERYFSEKNLHEFIEKNQDKNIFFCCDNKSYKLKLKEKYDNIIIINSEIGHTSLNNTTDKQVLDTITEFYILSNSETIFAASQSGFSFVASKFNNIPLIYI